MAINANKSNNRVALITGVGREIGFEVARPLARDEDRDEKAAEQLASKNSPVAYIQIDEATIDLAVTEVANADDRLDILVNNSSIYLKQPRSSELTLDTI